MGLAVTPLEASVPQHLGGVPANSALLRRAGSQARRRRAIRPLLVLNDDDLLEQRISEGRYTTDKVAVVRAEGRRFTDALERCDG